MPDDAGNVFDEHDDLPFVNQHRGFVFLLDLEQGRPRRPRLVPMRISEGSLRTRVPARMQAACAALGTTARPTPAGMEIEIGGG